MYTNHIGDTPINQEKKNIYFSFTIDTFFF
jgi:hypothetical protein